MLNFIKSYLKDRNLSAVINRVATQFFKKFFRFLKIRIFGSIFSSLKLKTVLNSINTLKRYCKATLNMFFYKQKIFPIDNIFSNRIKKILY